MTKAGSPDATLASLLLDRRVALAVTAASAAQVLAVSAGAGGWPCPLKSALGIPCPGCGLTRGTVALLRGEFAAALGAHAFAPLLLLGLTALAVAALLPAPRREVFAGLVARFERRTRAGYVLGAALLLYWMVRLLFLPGAFNG
ncbi:MAG: DUF2752 domain-containing protein [Acidobacteria bacterium]|nr:DUF2752 domain-containing protein [Acidobacteriota bacterium]